MLHQLLRHRVVTGPGGPPGLEELTGRASLDSREGPGAEGAAGATGSDQYGVLELRTNRSSEP